MKNAVLRRFFARLQESGFEDVREGHGCVFGFIDVDHGSRLTDLAERSGLTKQAVGEAADRARAARLSSSACPIRATAGPRSSCSLRAASRPLPTGRRLFAEIEREWAEEFGDELLAGLREAVERISCAEREQAHTGTALRM